MLKNCKVISDNTPIADYLSGEAKRGEIGYSMSRSALREVALNPRRWLAGYGDSNEDTRSTIWGSLVDCLVLQVDQFEKKYAVAPYGYQSESMVCPSCNSASDAKSCRKCGMDRVKKTVSKDWNANSKTCQEWEDKEIEAGRQVIGAELSSNAHRAALEVTMAADSLLRDSKRQVLVMGEWHDADSGLVIPVKALLDIVPDKSHRDYGKTLADLKTSKSANPRKWSSEVFNHGYHWQAAMHTDLYVAATGEDRCEFMHLIQENYPPYEVLTPLPLLSVEFVELGRIGYQSALRKYCQCLKTGIWPGYNPNEVIFGRQMISPESWMI